MMHRYFKMGNVSYRVTSDTPIFTSKIHVPTTLVACPCRINAVYGHHRSTAIKASKSLIEDKGENDGRELASGDGEDELQDHNSK